MGSFIPRDWESGGPHYKAEGGSLMMQSSIRFLLRSLLIFSDSFFFFFFIFFFFFFEILETVNKSNVGFPPRRRRLRNISHGLMTSFMKGRLAAIIYLFIVHLPKEIELSSHAVTVFFLSLSEYILFMAGK